MALTESAGREHRPGGMFDPNQSVVSATEMQYMASCNPIHRPYCTKLPMNTIGPVRHQTVATSPPPCGMHSHTKPLHTTQHQQDTRLRQHPLATCRRQQFRSAQLVLT